MRRPRIPAILAGAVLAGAAAVAAAIVATGPRAAFALVRAIPHGAQALVAAMAANWLLFVIGQIAIAASGVVPASLIAIMAGASFGMVGGTAISALSTMLGGWLAFRLSRSVLRRPIERVLRRRPGLVRLDDGMTKEGWRLVMLLRVSPVMPFAVTSYALGLTRIAERDFLLGTLASLPALVGYVAIGAVGQQAMLLASGQAAQLRLGALALGVLVLFYAAFRLRRAMERATA